MTDMRIRVARLGDAAAVAKVYVETWRSAYAGLVPNKVLTGMSEARQRRQWKAQIASGDTVMVADHPDRGVVGVGPDGRLAHCSGGGVHAAGHVQGQDRRLVAVGGMD